MVLKISQKQFALKISQFVTSENMALGELGTDQDHHVFKAGLAVHTHMIKNRSDSKAFIWPNCEISVSHTLLNSARFSRWILGNIPAKAQIPRELSVPTAFEV